MSTSKLFYFQGCGCDYRCVSLDEFRAEVRCICPQGWAVKTEDGACEGKDILIPNYIHINYNIDLIYVLQYILRWMEYPYTR